MDILIKLIHDHSDSYPEFEECIPTIEEAVSHIDKRPDRAIENCKSLIEGFSRSFILRLKKGAVKGKLKKMSFTDQVESAVKNLQKIEEASSIASPLSTIDNFIVMLRDLRNRRGEICHGRAMPKDEYSDKDLAIYIMQTTETILCYMLKIFYNASSSKEDSKDTTGFTYEQNNAFNNWLDEQYPLEDSKLIYSKALYDVASDDYREQFAIFEHDNEDINMLKKHAV